MQKISRSNKRIGLLVLFGAITTASFIVVLDLPSKIHRGEHAMIAIQSLDKMRRPFLLLNHARNSLLNSNQIQTAERKYATGFEQANRIFDEYKQAAAYDPELSNIVTALEITYRSWAAAEQELLRLYRNPDDLAADSTQSLHSISQINAAENGFQKTIEQLGEGEHPIHTDIEQGKHASRALLFAIGCLLVYLIGLVILLQHLKSRALRHARDILEDQVHERTSELRQTVEKLHHEVNVRLQMEQILLVSEREWRLTFDSISDFVTLHDKDLRVLRANKALLDYLGKSPKDVIGKYCHEVYRCSETGCPNSGCRSANEVCEEEIDKENIGIPLRVISSPVINDNGEVKAYVHVARDITHRKNYELGLKLLAHYDHLTGLANRTLLLDRLQQSIARNPWRNRVLALMFIDLDRFKIINDTFGHDKGDRLLTEVARRLQTVVRDGDTVARLGGDEFAICLVDVADISDISTIADKVLSTLALPFEIDSRQFFVTASIGISLHPEDAHNVDELIQHADIAMYHAKDQGKNNYQFYTNEIGTPATERRDLLNDLKTALEKGELELQYQPKVDLVDGVITGMEALLRWRHPVHGMIMPDEFIPYMEETGLIVPVGNWILHTACKQNKFWMDAGFAPMRISVNISARQFIQHDLVDDVLSALSQSGLDPSYLELEITETIILGHNEEAMAVLQQLSAHKVRITLDDFGTGYSSLGYLKRFPISALKIDKSFIKELFNNPKDAELTKAVIAMAKNLKLGVTAEGVEVAQQAEFLIENQCDEIQGYIFSKPLSTDEFECLLHDGRKFELHDILQRRATA